LIFTLFHHDAQNIKKCIHLLQQIPQQMLVRGSFVNAALVGVMAYGFFSTKLKGGAAKGNTTAVSHRQRGD